MLLNGAVIDCIRRELRRLNPGIKVEKSEIENILKNDILKRNVIDEDKAVVAQKIVKEFIFQQQKSKGKTV